MSAAEKWTPAVEAEEIAKGEEICRAAEAETREENARYWAHVETVAEQQYRELAAARKLEADVPETEPEAST
jgi:hypothetical protein